MKIFDLTPDELRTLLSVGQAVGIHTELDLLRAAEANNIASGTHLINFIYAAVTYGWRNIA